MKKTWVQRARRLMRDQKKTQDELIDIFDVKTTGAVSHYFTGRNEPSIDSLSKLAKFLNVSPQYLVYGGENNRDVNSTLLTQCSKTVRDINNTNNLNLNEEQQVQLVIYLYNQSQKDEGIELLSEKQIIDTAQLILST